jgi:acetolactate synthase I/II/III large subunit
MQAIPDADARMSGTTVADLVVDGLKRAGTPRLFAVATRGDRRLLDAARAGGLSVTLVTHELASCVMAGVTGDLVDGPGAVLIAHDVAATARGLEMLDGAPLIVLTSGHPSTVPGCKETLGVEAVSAAHRIAHAARLAMTGPRGPVHLDIAPGTVSAAAVPLATSCRPDPPPYPESEVLDRVARALSSASRPLLLAGLHCRSSDAVHWLRAFAEALPAPLLATPRAKGALPDPHPLALGVLGVQGVEEHLLSRADLVVALGLDTREADALPAACWSSAPMLALGPAALPDGRVASAHVIGDVSAIIEELAVRLRDKPRADWDVAEVDRLRREGAARGAGAGRFARIVRLAREATPAGTIATVDAGSYRAAVVTAWHAVAPRELLIASGGETGFALPAALAAHLVHPDRRVLCFTDAAGLGAVATELETAARLSGRIVVIVHETAGTDGSVPIHPADKAGLPAVAVESEVTFAQALGRALTTEGPALIVSRS